MKACVVGATGRTGQWIVQELVKQGIAVKAMVRSKEKALSCLPDSVELVETNVLNYDTIKAELKDCTHLFCATGATPSFNFADPFLVDYIGTKNLTNIAKEQGIERFILVSSLCVSKFFHFLNLFWLVLFWKKQAENYLISSGVPYTIVRPGGLLTEDNNDAIVLQSADTLFHGRIPRQKVAQVCVSAMFHESAKNKIIEIIAEVDRPVPVWDQAFAEIK